MAISDRDKERLNMIAPAANDVGLGDIIQDLQDAEGGSQSIAWADVTGKPSTFAPSAHTHAATDIASGTLDAARIPTLAQSKVTNLTTDLASKIAKSSVSGVAAIADPTTATAPDVAAKINELIAALKA